MLRINIHEAKTHLSRYAQRVKSGETIELCDRNKPFAQISPLPAQGSSKIKFGVAAGACEIPADFNEPLSGFEHDFYGKS